MSNPKYRRPVSSEDIKSWALARYEPSGEGGNSSRSLSALAKQFGRSVAVISRGIKRAFSEGLVKVVESGSYSDPPPRNIELEDSLMQQFPSLKCAIVVNVKPSPAGSIEEDAIRAYSDDVHKTLGIALAQSITRNPLDLDGKKIAVSSGRPVHSTAQEMARLRTSSRAVGVRVFSMSGKMFFKTNQTPFAPMDADRNAEDMINYFPRESQLEPIGMGLAHSPVDLKILRDRSWLAKWKDNRPDYAIIGVGPLQPGHRFWEYAKLEPEELKHYLGPVSDTLRSLIKLCKEICDEGKFYCPVADIANHLFFVEPPADIELSHKRIDAIKKLIAEFNRLLLNVDSKQLREIGHLVLVAGTRSKIIAIRQLLRDYERNLTCVAIDAEAASALIDMCKGPKHETQERRV